MDAAFVPGVPLIARTLPDILVKKCHVTTSNCLINNRAEIMSRNNQVLLQLCKYT